MVSSASILVLVLAQAAPGAGAVALLSAVGEAGEGQKRGVDLALRGALEKEEGLALLSDAETREQLSSLADLGLICLPEDTPCFVKLGMAAGVDLVLVPVVSEGGKGLNVEVRAVDVATSGEARKVAATLHEGEKSVLQRLALQALGRIPADPPPPPAEGEGEGEGEQAGWFQRTFGKEEEEEKPLEIPGPWRRAHRQPVELGFEDGTLAEIRSGLVAGDVVITVGNQSLRDDARVRLPDDPTLADAKEAAEKEAAAKEAAAEGAAEGAEEPAEKGAEKGAEKTEAPASDAAGG